MIVWRPPLRLSFVAGRSYCRRLPRVFRVVGGVLLGVVVVW